MQGIFWVGLSKVTIDKPCEIAALADDAVYLNAKLTSLGVTRCFLAVQRSPCTSIEGQHTAHIFTMKLCPVSDFWLFRDNVDGWQATLEFGEDGLSKPMTAYFSTMMSRVTRIEIYYFATVDKKRTGQQKGPDNIAKDEGASLRQILLAGAGKPKSAKTQADGAQVDEEESEAPNASSPRVSNGDSFKRRKVNSNNDFISDGSQAGSSKR